MSDAILDVVRGLTTVASFSIITDQVKTAWETLFTHDCRTCRGTGKMTCPKCHGTKTLRMRPAASKIQHASILKTNADDLYPCFACGPPTAYDADPDQEDDLDENYQIMDNLKFAAGNRKVPQPFGPSAGTVMCPDCKGSAVCNRHTPNLERMFGLEAPFWVNAYARQPLYAAPDESTPQMWEYPGKISGNYKGKSTEKGKAKMTEGGVTMTASEQYGLEDYQLPYLQDNEEPGQRSRKK